jgi:hypothetical protein
MEKPTKQEMERQIVEAVIDEALRLGYNITVWDGDDDPSLEKSTDRQSILDATLNVTDEIVFTFRHSDHSGPGGQIGDRLGWVQFVFGNDGYDVIADSVETSHVELICQKANDLSNQFAEQL